MISEITGMEGDTIQLQEIMNFRRWDVDDDGNILGDFHATGIRPRFLEDLEAMGLHLNPDYFDPSKVL